MARLGSWDGETRRTDEGREDQPASAREEASSKPGGPPKHSVTGWATTAARRAASEASCEVSRDKVVRFREEGG